MSKVRIKLLSPEGVVITDRLVDQATEFRIGPKEKHDGPISVELNLHSKEDVENALAYLGKLALDLPLEQKPTKALKKSKLGAMLEDKEPLLELLQTLKAKCNTQEELIENLREYNFKFLNVDLLKDINRVYENSIVVRSRDENLQFMVRLVKQAKNPINDKWDTRLCLGFDLNAPTARVVVYLWGKYHEKIKLGWKNEKNINTKKKDDILLSFPDFMDYEMRTRFRAEHRKWAIETENGKNPEAFDLSKFYRKWKPYVIIK